MKITPEIIQKMIDLVNKKYPDWKGFSDDRYFADEVAYKREAIARSAELLSKEALQSLLEQNAYDQIIANIEKVGFAGKNLLYLATPSTGDLSIIHREDLDKALFCRAFYELLYGDGPSPARLGAYSNIINANGWPNKWTFATYFLFVSQPQSEMFIKPSTTSWLMQLCGIEEKLKSRPTENKYAQILDLCAGLWEGLQEYHPNDYLDIQGFIWVAKEEHKNLDKQGSLANEFDQLFKEFIDAYLQQDVGIAHKNQYNLGREQAKANISEINRQLSDGKDITDLVLLRLLPYADTQYNRDSGAWVYVAAAITKDIKKKFEGAGWTKSDDWPLISKAILNFVNLTVAAPNDLAVHIKEFSDLDYSRGFQSGMLTPILNALNPEDFILVNNKSRKTINYFTNSQFDQSLTTFPSINEVAQKLVTETEIIQEQADLFGILPCDLFDMFSHWLVAIKKYDFGPKAALGKNFKDLFGKREDALLAFEFFELAFSELGIQDPDDPLIDVNFYKQAGELTFNFTFGSFLILSFYGSNGKVNKCLISILDGLLNIPCLDQSYFATREGSQKLICYRYDLETFKEHKAKLSEAFVLSLAFIRDYFENWKASPYHKSNSSSLASAILDINVRDDMLTNGIDLNTSELDENKKRYWKIAPGENAFNWDYCRNNNVIALGWTALGDLSGKTKDELHQVYEKAMETNPDWGRGGELEVWNFINLQVGDRIIANKGKQKILGVGTIIGPYHFEEDVKHGHQFPVQWEDLVQKDVNEPHWVRTIIELDKAKFDRLVNSHTQNSLFSERTFDLLDGIHQDPTFKYYSANKKDFKEFVEEPYKTLFLASIKQLNPEILETMEIEKDLFSRFNKNDHGVGGAWDYYWSAIYPKGGKRTTSPQLFMVIDRNGIQAGFTVGDYYDNKAKKKFSESCGSLAKEFIATIQNALSGLNVFFGKGFESDERLRQPFVINTAPSFQSWINNPDLYGIQLVIEFSKDYILGIEPELLINTIVQAFNIFYVFMLIAINEDSAQLLRSYLKKYYFESVEKPQQKQPLYSLDECSNETGISKSDLERWVRAIDRKMQAIFFGPPGTGKTFIAEKLAKHLIGGGVGFSELIQFHPEISYEDFMQGIRPIDNGDGGLSYPLVPGRFLDFCEKASNTQDKCVLIIDEINRANLSRVFGELMYLLEYRNKKIPLAAGKEFSIPSNVRIIGTMNTADRSIALVDHALRRRFAFLSLYPDYEILRKYHIREETRFNPEGLISVLEDLNKHIQDQHYFIGCSYFLNNSVEDHIQDIWEMEIEPYIEEFFFDQADKYIQFTWQKVRDKIIND